MLTAATRKTLAEQLRDEAERIRTDCEERMAKLFEAATEIESGGECAAAPDQPEPSEVGTGDRAPSVVEMIREAALSFGASVILTHENLRGRAVEKHPEHTDKIKPGLYNAIVRLIERGELKKVPGGFQRTEKMPGQEPQAVPVSPP